MGAFEVKQVGDQSTFLNLIAIASNHYVTARVCLQNTMFETGCLLAQQSIEKYAKGIMRLFPEYYYFSRHVDPNQANKIKVWGHDLVSLLRDAAKHSPNLDAILGDEDLQRFLAVLSESYDFMKYGEGSGIVNLDAIIRWLDRTVSVLDETFFDLILKMPLDLGSWKPLLYVPDAYRKDFLRNNTAFDANKITNQSPPVGRQTEPPKT